MASKQNETMDWDVDGLETPSSEFEGVATEASHDEEEFAGGLDALDLDGGPSPAPRKATRNTGREEDGEAQAGEEARPQSWIARLWQAIARLFGGA